MLDPLFRPEDPLRVPLCEPPRELALCAGLLLPSRDDALRLLLSSVDAPRLLD
ncbi:MAG: hypothetical protein ACO1PZ_13640 [Gammaproteobacteria bacterium]